MMTRLKRYLMFGIEYFLWEKPRGLDFTMRDTSLLKSSNGLCHGYSKTAEKHLKKIFSSLTFDGSERLLGIAVNNFRILKMEGRIQCFQADAAEFRRYGDYNIFFLFNPFSDTVMAKVVGKLLDISERNPVTVIYHNPVYMEIFEQKGKVMILKELYDKTKDYSTYIFRIAGSKK